MSRSILSIDIRDEAISALRISSTLKGNRIESQFHIRLNQAPPDTENRLLWAFSQMADAMDTSGCACILSVPPSAVIYRNVTVPFKERRKIGQLLPFELESSLPRAVEEFTIDFDIVRKSDYTDIIAAAVKTETIDDILGMTNRFGIYPGYITISPVAEAMSLIRFGVSRAENLFFISIDDSCATACILLSGKLYLSRTFKLPGKARRYLKKEVLRIIAAFETIYDTECRFDEIVVSNVCSGVSDDEIPDITLDLEEIFERKVKSIDMFRDVNLKIIAGLPDNQLDQRLFNAALGLAGIEIGGIAPFNFSRDANFIQKYWLDNKTECITAGTLLVFVFILIMANAIFQVRSLEGRVNKLDNEIVNIFRSTLPGETRIVDPLHQMKTEVDRIRQRGAMSANSVTNITNIDILNEISRLIPSEIDVLITNLVRSDDHVSISGTIATFNAVDEVKGQLEKTDIFEKITISSANMDNSINRVRFRIRADLTDLSP